jgi:hypothetical protein
MTALSFKIINHGSYEAAVKLREGILRKPLGLTFLPEELEAEKEHIRSILLIKSSQMDRLI